MKNILHKMIIVQQLFKDGLRKYFPIKKNARIYLFHKKSFSLQQSIFHYAIFYNARTNEITRTIHCHSQTHATHYCKYYSHAAGELNLIALQLLWVERVLVKSACILMQGKQPAASWAKLVLLRPPPTGHQPQSQEHTHTSWLPLRSRTRIVC